MKDHCFVIPYVDQSNEFWEDIHGRYSTYIKEVYFPLINDEIGTGRPVQPTNFLNSFLGLGVFPVSVILNPVVLPKPLNKLEKDVLSLLEELIKKYKIQGITLSNVGLAKSIKKNFPSLSITASTLMEIHSPHQLVMLENFFDTIVPSNRIIRNISQLKTLRKAFQGNIRLIVNEACLSSCVYRAQHFYEMSRKEIINPLSLCTDFLELKPWMRLTGGWILPQHLFFYQGLFDEIKLAGRVTLQNPNRYYNTLDSYIFSKPMQPHQIGAGPASVNIPIEVNSDFFKYTLYCDKDCQKCNVCNDYWNANTG